MNEINHNAINFEERIAFQVVLINLMLGKDHEVKTREEKFTLELDWANKYAKKVSHIIDNPENKEVRDLLYNHKYQEAANLVVLKLI